MTRCHGKKGFPVEVMGLEQHGLFITILMRGWEGYYLCICVLIALLDALGFILCCYSQISTQNEIHQESGDDYFHRLHMRTDGEL